MVLSELNADDQKVFVAISNLIYNGNTKVTRTQLYRFMQQNPNAKPTQSQLERIDQSIRKMASIYLKLDAKALFEIYPDLERIPVGSNFIEVVEWAERRTANGQFSEYYEFKRQLPILWQYSLIVGQMATIQINDRSPYSTKLRNTADNKEIVQIIGDRILALLASKQNSKNFSNKKINKIPYKNFFDVINFSRCKSEQSKINKKNRAKKAIKQQAQFLVTNGVIDGFVSLKDGLELIIY